MSWQIDYKKKLRTPDEALRCVSSGMRVYIQPGCAEPETLVDALMKRGPFVEDVEIVHMMTMGTAPYVVSGDGRTFPAQCGLHRRQCARCDQRRPRGLHANLPQRDRRTV